MPKEYETKVRDICNIHNQNIDLDNVAFYLPQHISLKISFECKEYLKAIKILEDILSETEPITVEVVGINKIPSIIWLDIGENEKLKSIHENIDSYVIGISENGNPGTYNIVKIIK